MKLIIQIPCYNESETLSVTLKSIPRKIEGFSEIEFLIIDDGSTDNTIEVAKRFGVDHIVSFNKNLGLARAFMAGLDACIKLGADVIVNTDADNQYNANDIPKLVSPILKNKAEIVIGARQVKDIKHFTLMKKIFQWVGSWVVRKVSNTNIPDAPSGFRAISRDAALKINVFNDYTYTIETIIQAGWKDISITYVPIEVNEDLRPSRLFKSISSYIKKSIITIVRIFAVYKPFRFFVVIGITLFFLGFLIAIRYLYFLIIGSGEGHIQSLILVGILIGMGVQTILFAFLADLIGVNRKLLEDIQYKLRKNEINNA